MARVKPHIQRADLSACRWIHPQQLAATFARDPAITAIGIERDTKRTRATREIDRLHQRQRTAVNNRYAALLDIRDPDTAIRCDGERTRSIANTNLSKTRASDSIEDRDAGVVLVHTPDPVVDARCAVFEDDAARRGGTQGRERGMNRLIEGEGGNAPRVIRRGEGDLVTTWSSEGVGSIRVVAEACRWRAIAPVPLITNVESARAGSAEVDAGTSDSRRGCIERSKFHLRPDRPGKDRVYDRTAIVSHADRYAERARRRRQSRDGAVAGDGQARGQSHG